MNSSHRKALFALSWTAIIVFAAAKAPDAGRGRLGPLLIQDQGSFAVGGSVTTAPGVFDPIRQGTYNPAGTDPAGA